MPEFMELLDSITTALDDMEADLGYEYEREIEFEATVDVEINNGGCMDYDITGTTTIYLTGRDLMDETATNAVSTIREAVRQLLEQGDPNLLPDGDDDPFALREPWPGSAEALTQDTTRQDFAQKFDPPTGYAYTGEYRAWMRGELFLSSKGRVERAANDGPSSDRRHILRELPGTTAPTAGSTGILPAPARELSASSPDPEF